MKKENTHTKYCISTILSKKKKKHSLSIKIFYLDERVPVLMKMENPCSIVVVKHKTLKPGCLGSNPSACHFLVCYCLEHSSYYSVPRFAHL